MKTPRFWYEKSGILAYLLRPLAYLYQVGARLHHRLETPFHSSVPIICVGNITLGGSGKTPTVIALARMLQAMHYTPHILCRGYKGKISHVHKVTEGDKAEDVGDEAMLLAKVAPTWVCVDKKKACMHAIQGGADILLLDDGLQHNNLAKDLTFLVMDGQQGVGNGELFPAGPLRTPLGEGIQKSDAILVIHESKEVGELLKNTTKPIFHGYFEAALPIPPQKIIAFAGLGYPKKFKLYLESQGFDVVKFVEFPDHHTYLGKDIHFLKNLQKTYNLPLLTTEKDSVKIPPFSDLYTVPINLVFKNNEGITQYLSKNLPIKSPKPA